MKDAQAGGPGIPHRCAGMDGALDAWGFDVMLNQTIQGVADAQQEDGILTATGGTFSSLVLEGQGPIVVEFMSYGCSHCRAIEPVLQRIVRKATFRTRVFRVNVAVEPELASQFEITGTPTLVMFLDGKEVGRAEGPRPAEANLLAAMTRPFA